MHLALFLIFGAICVAGAINLLVQSHPINGALSLVVVMASLAVEYLLLGAEFVAAVQVIVYAGAIMVLFVFVIMLLNAGEEEHTKGSRVALLFGVPGMIIINVFKVNADGSVTSSASPKIIMVQNGTKTRLDATMDKSTLPPGLYGMNIVYANVTSRVMFTVK